MADPATSAAAGGEFHELRCTAAGHELATELIRMFWSVYRQTEVLIGAPRTPTDALVAKHQLIVDAIAVGDAIAISDAVHRHFDEVCGRLDPERSAPH